MLKTSFNIPLRPDNFVVNLRIVATGPFSAVYFLILA
jgi:hypothetical protein